MNIIARLRSTSLAEPMTLSEPTSPAHELADAVKRGPRLQLAEKQLASLRDTAARLRRRGAEIRDSRELIDEQKLRELKAISQEQEANDVALRECRIELAPLRQERAARVERELQPMRQEAAQKVAAAATELKAALHRLNVISDALRLHAVDAPSIHCRALDDVINAAKGI